MFFFLVVFGPAVDALPAGTGIPVLDQGRRKFELISWIAIALLLATGILNFFFRVKAGFQFTVAYESVLAVKLLLFFAMTLHHCFQAFKYAPGIASLTAQAQQSLQSWPEPLRSHWTKWFLLLKINATLGVIVILLGIALGQI